MKHTSVAASLLAFSLLILPLAASAQGTPVKEYLLVDDLPFVKDLGDGADIASYLKALFQLGIGLAVLLSVLMLVVNGIKYMVSDITNEKAKARLGMKDAVIGLLIVFGSVLILNTINPRLTEFNIVDAINRTKDAIRQGQSAAPRPPAGAGWPSDAAERLRLAQAGIGINKENCSNVGQTGCTSVANLSNSAIEALINLKTQCDKVKGNCNIVVTGGTEHWLHSTHGDNRTIDLRSTPTLNSYLGGKGTSCGFDRVKDGHTYNWEDKTCSWCTGNAACDEHWHVKY